MSNQKDVLQRQSEYVQFRISKDQYAKLKQSGETLGLSPNLYAKQLALRSHLRKPYFNKDDFQTLHLELTRQGNNLNQIAKRLNQLDHHNPDNQEVIKALRYTYGVLDQTQKEYQQLCRQLQK